MVRPVPGLPIEDQPLPVLRRMVMWGEARGESAPGKLAILCVLQNRITDGGFAKGVILKPKAFSCFGDPDRLLRAHDLEPNAWSQCDVIAELWENGCTNDITQGADHYYNYNIVSPAWGRGSAGWQETVTIGNHVFGRCP